MARFLDSAVLVPVFVADHPHHDASIRLYKDCSRQADWCAAHSLAEVYSTLTRLPQPHNATPAQALVCVEDITTRLRCISLDDNEYLSTIKEATRLHIGGGTIYDALIARCAVKAGADEIFTWNIRHYQLLGAEITKRLTTPA